MLVPRHPGILCALGLLLSDLKTNYAQTRLMPLDAGAVPHDARDVRRARARAPRPGSSAKASRPAARTLRRTVDMRYAGQNYELPVPLPDAPSPAALVKELTAGFERAHEQMYGYIAAEEPIQAVTFRLEAVGAVRRAELRAQPRAATTTRARAIVARRERLARGGGAPSSRARSTIARSSAPATRSTGPAVVEQMDATTLLLPGQTARVDQYLNLVDRG